MTSSFKWIVASLTLLAMVAVVVYASGTQNITVRTTAEVEVLENVLGVGSIRAQMKEDRLTEDEVAYFDLEEVIANLVANVTTSQKKHRYDIRLDYVFLDKDGQVTVDEKKVRSIQFRVQHVNQKGEVKGSAERRLSLHELSE